MHSNKVTIIDVARQAGVSPASVSRFINNSACLKDATRKKIASAIKKLNYQPFVYAQKLAGGRLGIFGLVIPGYEGIFYSFYAMEVIRSIGQALEGKDIDLHLNVFWERDNFKDSLVDGVIFADVINNQQQFLRLHEKKVPLVVINKKIYQPRVNFVAIDNFRGAYEATEFLIKHGHKRIVHLSGDLNTQCAQERFQGYKKALTNNKIAFDKKNLKETNFSRILARRAAEEIFSQDKPPTAIFSASDQMAQEVLNFAREKKINVPGDLSIVGFDDDYRCVYDDFALTTVRQPLTDMGITAVKILQQVAYKKKDLCVQKILKPELIIRDTVDFI